MQVRDLIEELQRQDQTASVICVLDRKSSDIRMPIAKIGRYTCGSRDVAVTVHEDNRISGLEDENEKLETLLKQADGLLERLVKIQDYVEQADKDEGLKPLMEDVEKYLDAR